MAGELLGPDSNSRTVWLAPGQSAHGRTATIYSNSAGTTLATILTYDGTGTPGAAISGSQVTIDAESQIPLFWFPSGGVDTLYARINGRSGVLTLNAGYDARLDVQGAAVADLGALTSAQLTGGESPTEAEFNALQTDVAAVRTKINALLASLRAAGIIAT